MDWTIIIPAILGSISIAEFIYIIINPKAARKKPEIENKSANADANKTIIETAKELMAELKEDRKDADERYDQLEQKYDAKIKELDAANTNLAVCGMLICKNILCPMRDPRYGLGKDFIERCTEEAEMTNTTPIEDIAEAKGYKIQKTKRLSVTE